MKHSLEEICKKNHGQLPTSHQSLQNEDSEEGGWYEKGLSVNDKSGEGRLNRMSV